MKKFNLHIYIAIAVFVATFIIGSFFDYQINDALFHEKDTFGLTISVIGTIPGYGLLAFLGGGALYIGLKNIVPNKAWRVVMFVLAIAGVGCAIFFSGREFFGPNGFYWIGIEQFWGYFIIAPLDAAIMFLGYKVFSKSNNEKLWVIILVLLAAYLISLVSGVTLIKSIFHRPRFRSLGIVAGLDYHPWWSPCSNYKELIASDVTHTLISEEFKSFPSGHAGTAAVFMMGWVFLPLIDPKYEKISIIGYYCGFAWLLLVAFSRMYVGAHFLSDVSMGALLPIVSYFIAKLVIEKVKYFTSSQESTVTAE